MRTRILSLANKVIFPLAIAFNMFAMTGLLIFLSLFGKFELAAEVGIIQGAILAVFMAFSANARNLILAEDTPGILIQLFKFRLLLIIPLSLVSFLLSISVIKTSIALIFLLILRRSVEWVSELTICEREKNVDNSFAYIFVFWQVISFILLLVSIQIDSNPVFYSALGFWALVPLFQVITSISHKFSWGNEISVFSYRSMLPHIGSSWIISVTTYIFRVIIMLLENPWLVCCFQPMQ